MNIKKLYSRYGESIIEWTYLVIIYFASRLPMRDFDIWFHLKSGELFVQKGLTATEVFSHAAQGREWITFEWLFQVVTYLLHKAFGMEFLPWFIGLFIVFGQFILLRILRDFVKLPIVYRILIMIAFFAHTYDFNTVRPHIIAYSFVFFTIYLILRFIEDGKKWVYYLPLLVVIWTNAHSTGFLSWGLLGTFAVLSFIAWLIHGEKRYIQAVVPLLILSGVCMLITISPPMYFRDYKLLWTFFTQRKFLGLFVSEWSPIADDPLAFLSYTIYAITGIGVFLAGVYKSKNYEKALLFIPFIVMAVMGYSASRNVFLGMFGILILFSYGVAQFDRVSNYIVKAAVILPLASAFLIYHSMILMDKRELFASQRLHYPMQAAAFAKKYLKGHMFNEYTYGGFLLYELYPKLQVLIDGRADLYICCEMQDYVVLSKYKNAPDDQYMKVLDQLFSTYTVDFVILSTQKHSVIRKMSRLLNTNPQWSLVFWDDDSQIFVKRNGKNDSVISQMDAKFATPYLRDPFVTGHDNEAMDEYKRMNEVAPSARSMQMIGTILMQHEKIEEAKQWFVNANDQDPGFESPYMSLGELAALDNDIDTAIGYYMKAQSIAPDRGLIYIRLGQLVMKQTNDRARVREIWEKGVKLTVDEEAKKQLQTLLKTL